MKGFDWLKAIGFVGDDLIEEAEYMPRKESHWGRYLALAACACIVVGLGTMALRGGSKDAGSDNATSAPAGGSSGNTNFFENGTAAPGSPKGDAATGESSNQSTADAAGTADAETETSVPVTDGADGEAQTLPETTIGELTFAGEQLQWVAVEYYYAQEDSPARWVLYTSQYYDADIVLTVSYPLAETEAPPAVMVDNKVPSCEVVTEDGTNVFVFEITIPADASVELTATFAN